MSTLRCLAYTILAVLGSASGLEDHEHAALVQKFSSVKARMATETPVAMKKMSGDPGEMFFPDYWIFNSDAQDTHARSVDEHSLRQPSRRDVLTEYNNATSLVEDFLPPFLVHSEQQSTSFGFRNLPRNLFDKRDFQCPTNTTACTSINRPNSCCAADETCVIIKDTGIGDVGCCPKGSTCGGSVGTCDTAHGYQSCPGSANGGCCIPNYSCNGIGCAAGGTATSVTVVLTTVSVTSGGSTSATSTTAPVVPAPAPPASIQVSTSTVFVTAPPSVSTTTVSSSPNTTSSVTCASGFNSCPASLGGMCCPSNSMCASNSSCVATSTSPPDSTTSSSVSTTTTTDAAGPPVRPTSGTSSSTNGMCPMGFYACSAYEVGGCCQTGRNCDTTSCPSSTTQTVVSSGLTIVVPGAGPVSTVGASGSASAQQATTTATSTTSSGQSKGQCPMGWNLCAASQGGGCCPTGYGCAASCTATAGASPGTVAKASPDSRGARVADEIGPLLVGIMAVGVGAAMVAL